MLFIPLVEKQSTQRAFAEAETLLVLEFIPLKISLILAVQIFQQINLRRASQAQAKSGFWLKDPW